jgi:hypothetical protein
MEDYGIWIFLGLGAITGVVVMVLMIFDDGFDN